MDNETMARLRAQAESEQMDNVYGMAPTGFASYGNFDSLGGSAVKPYFSPEDELEIRRLEEQQRVYNAERGTEYSGGPTQAPAPLAPATGTYSNGGQFMPHVGNAWYQADEPLLPWNRKDWDATRAGMADKAVKWYSK